MGGGQKGRGKGSDVNIGTRMLIDAYENQFDAAVLISNDSDLVMPVYHVNRKLKKTVIVLNPQEYPSTELRKAARKVFQITPKHVKSCLFEKEFTGRDGKKIICPDGWLEQKEIVLVLFDKFA